MKRRYAYSIDDNYKQIRVEEDFFKGYACFLRFQNIKKPLIVNNSKEEICIKDNGYEWIEVYPDDGKYAITIMFDDNSNLIEWYFDISKNIGIENGIPYEDDLYLDLIITSTGERLVIDEDELLSAKENGEITQDDVNLAYSTLEFLDNKYCNNFEELKNLTCYLLNKFKDNAKIK